MYWHPQCHWEITREDATTLHVKARSRSQSLSSPHRDHQSAVTRARSRRWPLFSPSHHHRPPKPPPPQLNTRISCLEHFPPRPSRSPYLILNSMLCPRPYSPRLLPVCRPRPPSTVGTKPPCTAEPTCLGRPTQVNKSVCSRCLLLISLTLPSGTTPPPLNRNPTRSPPQFSTPPDTAQPVATSQRN